MDEPTLRQLRTFLALVESGSVSAAARQQRLSQPAASQQLRALEKCLGVRVLQRQAGRMVPTPAGTALLAPARRALAAVEEAVEAVAAESGEGARRLRLGTGATACIHLLPPVLRGMRRLLPHLEVTVSTGDTLVMLRLLEEGALDAALVSLPATLGRSLAAMPVMRDEFVALAPVGLLPEASPPEASPPKAGLAERMGRPDGESDSTEPVLNPAALAAVPLILYGQGGVTRRLVDGWFRAARVVPEMAMELDSAEAIRMLVASGLGATVLPALAVAPIPEGTRRYRLHPPLARQLALVLRQDKVQDRPLRSLLRELQRTAPLLALPAGAGGVPEGGRASGAGQNGPGYKGAIREGAGCEGAGLMEFRTLEVFQAVASLRSFGRAAEALHMTQSAVSQRILNLEAELGGRLFTRTIKGGMLTAKGLALQGYAEKLLNTRNELMQALANVGQESRLVRLGVAETIAQSWLPRFVAEASARFPFITFEIDVDVTSKLRARLLQREIDLGFLLGELVEPGVTSVPLCAYAMRFIASSKRVFGETPVSAATLSGHAMITFPKSTVPYWAVREIFQQHGLPVPRIHASSSISNIIRMTLDDVGISIMAPELLEEEFASGRLVMVETKLDLPDIEFMASYVNTPGSTLLGDVAQIAAEVAASYAKTHKLNRQCSIMLKDWTLGRRADGIAPPGAPALRPSRQG